MRVRWPHNNNSNSTGTMAMEDADRSATGKDGPRWWDELSQVAEVRRRRCPHKQNSESFVREEQKMLVRCCAASKVTPLMNQSMILAWATSNLLIGSSRSISICM